MSPRRRPPELPAPYLRRILLDADKVADWIEYPFSLPLFAARDFELPIERAVTILVGETEHFRLLKRFFEAPEVFVDEALEG